MNKQRTENTAFVIVDVLMMVVLFANLSLILFDWLFMTGIVKQLLFTHASSFYQYYDKHIHQNFHTIDLGFVAIFLTELLIRWGIAIRQRAYHRWFFFPFAHWYDALGCLPIASFRFLRILRIVSILYRLQRLGTIDLKKTYLFRVINTYYAIIVEEISDRVMINFINGVQNELKSESSVTDQIIDQVIMPRKELLTEWLASRIGKVAADTYQQYKTEIHQYLEQLVGEAIKGNKEVKAIKQVPVVGGFIGKTLERAVADIALKSVNGIMEDLSGGQHHTLFHEMTGHAVEGLISKEEQDGLSMATRAVLVESLELIKAQIKIQQWKV